MKLAPVLAACLLAASTLSFAQAPQGDAGKKPGAKARFDCSQAKDPKGCEERRAKLKAAHDKALKTCEGKTGGERRDCMRTAMCAEAKDPKACEAKAKEIAQRNQAQREKIREACKGKEGDALKACVREQRGAAKK
jgi:Spy/CpxP family protein refolding chaperone